MHPWDELAWNHLRQIADCQAHSNFARLLYSVPCWQAGYLELIDEYLETSSTELRARLVG